MSSIFEHEDIAKLEYFYFYAFFETWGYEHQFIFMKGVPASRKLGNLWL